MGTKLAPSYTNLFLVYLEANALENASFQSHTWLRYIDDIFMIWTKSLGSLKIFIDYLSNIHTTIKFTSSHSSTNTPFLGSITTDLYTKPTDKHQHLHLSIPYILKKPSFQSSTPLTACICSTDETFNTRAAQLTNYLLKPGYNRKFVTRQIRRASTFPADLLYKPKTSTNLNVYYLFFHLIHHFLTSLTSSKTLANSTIFYSLLTAVKKFSTFTCSSLQTLLRDLSVTANLSSVDPMYTRPAESSFRLLA